MYILFVKSACMNYVFSNCLNDMGFNSQRLLSRHSFLKFEA